jgi:transcriptional regulator with XRE-family HTH domain
MQLGKHKWWYAYGPFDPGENNLPHLGQVIRHYRELHEWKAKDLADALGQSVRHIYEIESSANMPELISRRQALSEILKIPPVLLGLAVITSDKQIDTIELPENTAGTTKIIDSQQMSMYEGILSLSWELYYTASAQRAANNTNYWLQFLINAIESARGVQRDQLTAMLCRFYQLSSVAAKDHMNMQRAAGDAKKAVELAFQLENSELISASLFRRARTYLKLRKYEQAIQDLEAALPYADRSRDPLRGYVYQTTAEAYSVVGRHDLQLQKKSLTMLDQVGRIVRKGNIEDDGSYVKLNIAGLYMDRAAALTLFQKTDEAHNALNIARDNLGPELTRWQARLLIADAQAYLVENDPESSCELAFEALKVVRATQSRSNEQRVYNLYQQLHDIHPHHPLIRRLGVQLSTKSL